MYTIPPKEHLVQTKTCRHCSALFPITDKDLEFYEKISPSFPCPPDKGGGVAGGLWVNPTETPQPPLSGGLKKYLLPPPTLCPDCRRQRRLSFRNERNLYKRKCNATGKDIISLYSPDKPFTVYAQDFWWSDKWDAMSYGRDFDFGKSFFAQFQELRDSLPLLSLDSHYTTNENSDYTNNTGICKDCYLTFNSGKCVSCHYSTNCRLSTDCHDCLGVREGHNCYECSYCHGCSQLFRSEDCTNCSDSHYLKDCVNCRHCFDCQSLHGKEFCIRNEQCTESEYFDRLPALLAQVNYRPSTAKIVPTVRGYGNEDCIGDQLYNCKNSFECYDNIGLENCKWGTFTNGTSGWTHNSYDFDYFGTVESVYEVASVGISVFNARLSLRVFDHITDVLYCMDCTTSKDLFWCIGLRNKQYCILNKQYTREEYEALVPRIIEHMQKTGEWGEFFPSSLSPFGYNETVAMEYYPMKREGVLSLRGETEAIQDTPAIANLSWKEEIWPGSPRSARDDGTSYSFRHWPVFNWSDYEAPFPRVEKIIPADKLPDDVSKIPDDILNWAIECEVTKKPFRIIKQELEFYRKHNLPIPRRHPDQRHLDRMALRNPRKLFERKCDKCGVEMVTTYSPDRKEIVYCESCYNKEVVG